MMMIIITLCDGIKAGDDVDQDVGRGRVGAAES